VAALDLVTASGEVVTLDQGEPAGRLAGAVIALGALGVVSSLTLDLVPAFDLRQYVYEDMPVAELEGNLAEIFAGGYSVSVFTTWQGERVRQVWLKQLAGQEAPPRRWLGALLADGQRHPVPGASPAACTTQLGVAGPWHERLPHFRADAVPSSGDELQSEYLLPHEQAVEALRAIRRIAAEVGPALQVSEIRVVAADELWLSPSYRRDTVAVHFTWISDSRAVAPAISAVERELAPLGALPHWGKLSAISPASLASGYERAADFARLRRELDPAGKFGNELTGALFPAAS
jgi:xylitol oxidase